MLNSPGSRYIIQPMPDTVNAAGIAAATSSRGDAAHEVAAIFALVAGQKNPGAYLGQSPDADYLNKVPHMQVGQTPNPRIESLVNDHDKIQYDPKGGAGIVSSDLRMLASSMYQNESSAGYSASSPTLDAKMFDYKPGGNCGYQ
jgi:hypothetical protein